MLFQKGRAKEMEVCSRGIGWWEEWNPLNVILMHMAEQDCGFDCTTVQTSPCHQTTSQSDDARPCIQNNSMPSSSNLDAWRVTAYALRTVARYRIAAAYTPELHLHHCVG